jgi:hypothetical protein
MLFELQLLLPFLDGRPLNGCLLEQRGRSDLRSQLAVMGSFRLPRRFQKGLSYATSVCVSVCCFPVSYNPCSMK